MIDNDDADFVSHHVFYPSFSCASSLFPCGASSLNDDVSDRRSAISMMTWTTIHCYHCCHYDDDLVSSNVVLMNAGCFRCWCRHGSPDFGFDFVSSDHDRGEYEACACIPSSDAVDD